MHRYLRIMLCAALALMSIPVLAQVQKYPADGSLRDMPFSESVRAGDLLFISGQVGSGFSGKLVEGVVSCPSHASHAKYS